MSDLLLFQARMKESVPESAEDNGTSVITYYPEIINHRSSESAESMENVSEKGLLVFPDDDHQESVGSPERSNNVGSLIRVQSSGRSVHSVRKGFGLKKWRRIKRDGPAKDEAAPVDDGSKFLKRGLTGLVNPPSKHVDVSSVEARQNSEGSVGSVNMVHHHHPGIANGFSPDPDCIFTVGQAFDKSEEHSGNSIGAKNVGGKSVSGSQGKLWRDTINKASEERVKTDKEKPCSSMDSHFSSSDFVFSSGVVSVANNGEKDERLMMNHSEGCSKEGQVREEVQTHSRGENGFKKDDENESKKFNNHWEDKDPLAMSIQSFAALQETLLKEIQSFQEMGKHSVPLHTDAEEMSSPDQPRYESVEADNSTLSESKVLILKQKEKHMDFKLKEARAALEVKEARIQELENSKIESELEGIIQRKIETEIQHLILTRSLNSLQQPKKVHFLTEDPESNRGDILVKTWKLGFYILIQLILLVSILRFLVLNFSPTSRLVIPT